MLVGDLGELLDIADVARRIADAFAENRAGLVVDQLLDRLGLIDCGKADIDALARQEMREQRVGRAVELRNGNDIAAELGDIERGVVQRGLAGGDAQRFDAAFERRDAPLQHRVRRVADPAVTKALDFEIEQRRAMLGAVECVGDGLIDRHRHGLRGRIDLVTAVNCDGLAAHLLHLNRSAAARVCRVLGARRKRFNAANRSEER